MKKLFIKICKLFGFEILDQNTFSSPTLEKKLNEELSIINEKSIILPLGEVKITKKISSILIILRMNTDVEIWDQNKKRMFELPKIEYSKRSINSLIKSIKYCDNFYQTCLDRHDPFEKYLNEIYKNEICISPLKSLSLHLTNINSSYGLSPFIDYKKLWEENKIND